MPWFDKVLQKDSKSVEEKIGNRMKALNEKTLQKEKNEEFKKKISSQMNAIERKTTSTKRDECNANRRRRLAESGKYNLINKYLLFLQN
uniref:Uncharacterized protein n=1 Tax=Panagrolaimus superbus TaxID=310955 RepID=A0A914YKS4_9BILA